MGVHRTLSGAGRVRTGLRSLSLPLCPYPLCGARLNMTCRHTYPHLGIVEPPLLTVRKRNVQQHSCIFATCQCMMCATSFEVHTLGQRMFNHPSTRSVSLDPFELSELFEPPAALSLNRSGSCGGPSHTNKGDLSRVVLFFFSNGSRTIWRHSIDGSHKAFRKEREIRQLG